MKHKGITVELFNLIKNENGFEESVGSGEKHELEKLKSILECENELFQDAEIEQVWERVDYYIVPKREWDIEHCPLMPVDFS